MEVLTPHRFGPPLPGRFHKKIVFAHALYCIYPATKFHPKASPTPSVPGHRYLAAHCETAFRDTFGETNFRDTATSEDRTSECPVIGVSNVLYFETAFNSVRASSIWSYAYAAMAAVVIVSPLRASDS